MKFNVNDTVRVRLTDVGRQIVKHKHDELNAFLRARNGTLQHGDGTVTEDADGWSEWLLWQLMQTFGPYMYNGCSIPFETTIELPLPEPPT